uniref:NAC domain-containing protein 1-like n=1 Tax=Erigeron canadensis TaxID=72917 RepID=UPI001CB960D2|nr:NAC domain-containing protein 1-like [Erigeron canadensis]
MDGKHQGGGGHGVAAADYASSLGPGYRFCPTDSELIVYYLKPKIERQIHPRFARFYDVNIYDYHPKELAAKYAGCEDKWYFLTRRQPKYANGKRPNRQTKDEGTWRASQCYTQVLAEDSDGGVVGFKRSLAYFEHHVKKTDWLMHEYTITDDNKMNDCALYKIYKKESKKKRLRTTIQEDQRNDYASVVQQVADQEEQQQSHEDQPAAAIKRRRRSSSSQGGGNNCPLQENHNNQPQQVVDGDVDELLAPHHKDYDKNNINSLIMLDEEEEVVQPPYDHNNNNNCLLQENNNPPAPLQLIDDATTSVLTTADHQAVGDVVMDELLAQLYYKDYYDDPTIDNDSNYYNIIDSSSVSMEEVLVQPTHQEEDNDGFDEIEALLYSQDDEDHQNIGHKQQYDSMPAADEEEDNYDEVEVAKFMKMLTYCSR